MRVLFYCEQIALLLEVRPLASQLLDRSLRELLDGSDAGDVAADKVTYNRQQIAPQHLWLLHDIIRRCQIIESIRYTVRKTAMNKQWYSKQQWHPMTKLLAFLGKSYSTSHQYSTTYTQYSTGQRTACQTRFQYSTSRFMYRQLGK